MKMIEVVVVSKGKALGANPNFAFKASAGDKFDSFINSFRPIFSGVERKYSALAHINRSDTVEMQNALARFYVGRAPIELVDEFVKRVLLDPEVETAYSKPPVENPIAPSLIQARQVAIESDQIPDFRDRQAYLSEAPAGVGVHAAWRLLGGRGANIRVIDIEGGWQLSHVDLPMHNGGLVGGAPYSDVGWRNHGTAVLGMIGADENAIGVTGIAPDAMLSAVSHGDLGSAGAIHLAAQKLQAGDVLLLEMHRPGPRYGFESNPDQYGYICVEWWPDDLLAIQYATSKGICVVEAAGNGNENLDDRIYGTPAAGFPKGWSNPLASGTDSGAIVVGAGAPPSGEYGEDRSRLAFSNYGMRVDCQGWGNGVVTAGYGDLFRLSSMPQDEDYWYTDSFSGTSSASPMVAGVIACVQGIAKARGATMVPSDIRNGLRTTGSPQQSNVAQRIGNRPDLEQLVTQLL